MPMGGFCLLGRVNILWSSWFRDDPTFIETGRRSKIAVYSTGARIGKLLVSFVFAGPALDVVGYSVGVKYV